MKKNNLKNLSTIFLICLSLGFVIFQAPKDISANDLRKFNRDLENYNVKLAIIDRNNQTVASFKVAIANDNKKRNHGLMNLKNLPATHGMLFLFEREQVVNMWMKNTLIPLDMIFIDKNNQIAHIENNAKPFSKKIISSRIRVNKVLEINAGLVKKFKIKIGDKINTSN